MCHFSLVTNWRHDDLMGNYLFYWILPLTVLLTSKRAPHKSKARVQNATHSTIPSTHERCSERHHPEFPQPHSKTNVRWTMWSWQSRPMHHSYREADMSPPFDSTEAVIVATDSPSFFLARTTRAVHCPRAARWLNDSECCHLCQLLPLNCGHSFSVDVLFSLLAFFLAPHEHSPKAQVWNIILYIEYKSILTKNTIGFLQIFADIRLTSILDIRLEPFLLQALYSISADATVIMVGLCAWPIVLFQNLFHQSIVSVQTQNASINTWSVNIEQKALWRKEQSSVL